MELPKVEVLIMVNGEPVSLIDYAPVKQESPPKEAPVQPEEEIVNKETGREERALASVVEEANKQEAQLRQEMEGTQVQSSQEPRVHIKREISSRTQVDIASHILVSTPSEWISGDEEVTRPQAAYLRTLSREAGVPTPSVKNKGEASRAIEALREMTGKGPRRLNPKSFPTQEQEDNSISKKEQIKQNMMKIQQAIAEHHLSKQEEEQMDREAEKQAALKEQQNQGAQDIKVL